MANRVKVFWRAVVFLAALAFEDSARAQTKAIVLDVTTGFVPYANDVPVMFGAGIRLAKVHEIWARFGYMPTGDDVRYAFGVIGYHAALRPDRVVRPIFGGLIARLATTCTHDANGPTCAHPPLFIFAATGGVRIEPRPWLGLSVMLSLGVDSYPNPFGMVELGLSFFIPI